MYVVCHIRKAVVAENLVVTRLVNVTSQKLGVVCSLAAGCVSHYVKPVKSFLILTLF